MKKYFRLIIRIVKQGKLRAREQNFNDERQKSLESLADFVPEQFKKREQLPVKKKNSIVQNLVGQLAFIKASLTLKGGHLTAQNLAYVRIPKSGNTSLSYALLMHRYKALEQQEITDEQINFLADVNLRPAAHAKEASFFTVVRDPFKRLVSVYRDFFETPHTSFIYDDYLFGILPQHLTFAEFVDRVSMIPDRLKDQHLKPQYLFLKPYEQRGIRVTLYKLEETENLKNFLAHHHLTLPHRNKSGEAYDFTQYYTTETLRVAYTLYKTDIHTFNYYEAYEQLKSRVLV